nr:PE family protein [Mycobacterium simiae]
MSFLIAAPDLMAAAATDLAGLGALLGEANAAAAAATTGLLAAGGDEVSAAIAAVFSGHAQAYQTLGVQASGFHHQFVAALSAGAQTYAVAESAAASPLQSALNLLNAPFQAVLGRPLIGNGANGAPGSGAAGYGVTAEPAARAASARPHSTVSPVTELSVAKVELPACSVSGEQAAPVAPEERRRSTRRVVAGRAATAVLAAPGA